MPQPDDECPADSEGQPARHDLHPARPRPRRRTGAWPTLAAGLAALITGVALAEGLLIATGLVLAGIGVQLLDTRSEAAGGGGGRRPG
ncbi:MULTISPECIES: hypothetical protein [Streptomyces]|uniref:DUF3040 domain-containing protein n=2 Tax=Streptomyces TaxID=1883 RepID=A0ABW9IKI3_STRGJ|nr:MULTISPECIES: hypothetical protein [Streptomyces]GGW69986.1 hypothetical protein GCM10010350_63350 [Streptomyces galilaeus]